MTDDDPIDLLKVGADDAALEGVRSGRDPHDPVLLLLRDLLEDVNEQETPVPVGCGSTVLALAGDRPPERRTVRRGVLVAAVTAGVLSLSGVAAATTMAPAGTPLHGLGQTLRAAVGAAVGSVTPPDPVVPATPVAPSAAPSPALVPAAPAGAEVSAAARSAAAGRQVAALLDAAEVLLREGRTEVASARLDTAEVRLADVAAVERAALAERLADLREQVAAAAEPAPKPAGKPDAPRKEQPARETGPKTDPPKPAARTEEPKQEQPRAEREPAGKGAGPRASARTEQPEQPAAPEVGVGRAQLSKDASTKPRA